MEINSQLIKSTLDKLEIDYIWNNYVDGIYHIASLFSPISNGFYFYMDEDNFNLSLKSSLIMMDKEPASNQNHNQIRV